MARDFDKAGFSIAATLQRDTRRYSFQNDIQVIDLGIRLSDVLQHDLPSEDVAYGKGDPRGNLKKNGATDAEIKFLCSGHDHQRGYHGSRVELNAFASDQLVNWIEGKLQAHGIQKVIPDDTTLEGAYRRAVAIRHIEGHLDEIVTEASQVARAATIPPFLRDRVMAHLRDHPTRSWDAAIYSLAADPEEG